jgi:hypothetical protein
MRVRLSKRSWAARRVDRPGDGRPDRPPGHLQQLGDRCLGGVCHQPGDLVVEVPGVTGPVAGPGHLGDRRAVFATAHSGERRTAGDRPTRRGPRPASSADGAPGRSWGHGARRARTGASSSAESGHRRRRIAPLRRSRSTRSPSPGRHQAICAIRWLRARHSPRRALRTFEQSGNVGGDRRSSSQTLVTAPTDVSQEPVISAAQTSIGGVRRKVPAEQLRCSNSCRVRDRRAGHTTPPAFADQTPARPLSPLPCSRLPAGHAGVTAPTLSAHHSDLDARRISRRSTRLGLDVQLGALSAARTARPATRNTLSMSP